VWMATFGAIWAVAISQDGMYWAAGSRRGEIWVWIEQRLHLTWQAHADVVRALSFSPDGRHLSSAGYDGLVNVWDVESGALLWTGSHTTYISGLAYSPDGGWRMHIGWDAQAKSDAARPIKAVAMQPAQHGDAPLSERPLTVFVDGPTGFTYIYLFDQGWKFVGRIADEQQSR